MTQPILLKLFPFSYSFIHPFNYEYLKRKMARIMATKS